MLHLVYSHPVYPRRLQHLSERSEFKSITLPAVIQIESSLTKCKQYSGNIVIVGTFIVFLSDFSVWNYLSRRGC